LTQAARNGSTPRAHDAQGADGWYGMTPPGTLLSCRGTPSNRGAEETSACPWGPGAGGCGAGVCGVGVCGAGVCGAGVCGAGVCETAPRLGEGRPLLGRVEPLRGLLAALGSPSFSRASRVDVRARLGGPEL